MQASKRQAEQRVDSNPGDGGILKYSQNGNTYKHTFPSKHTYTHFYLCHPTFPSGCSKDNVSASPGTESYYFQYIHFLEGLAQSRH